MKESRLQYEFLMYVQNKYPAVSRLIFSIPNEGKRTYSFAARLKSTGLKSGMLDMMIAKPCGKYSGMFIEFKSENGVVSIKQKDMIKLLRENGYKVVVCYDLLSAVNEFESYINQTTNPVSVHLV